MIKQKQKQKALNRRTQGKRGDNNNNNNNNNKHSIVLLINSLSRNN